MVTSYVLVEGIRVGGRLEGLPLRLVKIERYRMPTATPEQPPVWTTVEFEFEESDAERVAAALSEVISQEGGWYTNFTVDDETFVIFAGRIFRYRRDDHAGRAEAAAYGGRSACQTRSSTGTSSGRLRFRVPPAMSALGQDGFASCTTLRSWRETESAISGREGR